MRFFKYFLHILLLAPLSAAAHVGYVVSDEEFAAHSGSDAPFLLGALADPWNILLIALSVVCVLFFYFSLRHARWFRRIADHVHTQTRSYDELIPWMIRLTLGISLIGAGTAGVLVSPALEGYAQFSFIQILIGFLLMAGFLLGPVSILLIVLYLAALSKSMYLVGNLDFLGLALTLGIIADARPGIDDLFGIPFKPLFKKFKKYVPLILRVGIGVAMMFLGLYEKILNPHLSELVVNAYGLTSVIPVGPEMWVLGAGVVEFLVGLLILLGVHTRLTSSIAFLILSLSFFYFGEDVYSHITLFGTLSILFVTGGGALSCDNVIAQRDAKERKKNKK